MRKMLISGVAFLGVAALVPVVAQNAPAPPGKPDASLATGGTYAVEPSHTQVMFAYKHFGFTTNMGIVNGGTGTLTLDPKAPETAKLTVEMPVKTIHTSSAKLDEEFQGPKFFDALKFPTAKFESTGVRVSGTSATITGNLTIHGVTKPVVLNATFAGAGTNNFSKRETVAFNATATIKRSDFGLASFVPLVGDDVALTMTAAFEKQ